jgi:hypothetical protein
MAAAETANGIFFCVLFLCLSRACLGKKMAFIYKWLTKKTAGRKLQLSAVRTRPEPVVLANDDRFHRHLHKKRQEKASSFAWSHQERGA